MSKTAILLGEEDREKVFSYIDEIEPEMNIFIRGDIEQFGMSNPVHVYALVDDEGEWDGLVLEFHSNFVCYSQNPLFDARAMAKLISQLRMENGIGSINGKYEVIEALSPYFDDLELKSLELSILDYVYEDAVAPAPDGVSIRKLTQDDYDDLLQMLSGVDELEVPLETPEDFAAVKRMKIANEQHGCVTYGAFYNGEIISTAATSAASSESAMVVGVATRSDMRRFGIGSAVMKQLCVDQLAEGKKFLTLFYHKERVGKMYYRIGFAEAGCYGMLR